MKNIKYRKIILFVIVISIILVLGLLISKFTTAYFAPSLGEDVVKKGEVTATGDSIIFTSGNSLSLSATTDNFKTGGSNLTSTTSPKVQLIASSKKNKADATYNVWFKISSNSYNYSTSNSTAEVLLTIKDNTGTLITSIDGLTYTTSGGVSGFDVTNKTGVYDVAVDKAITTSSSTTGTTHTWTFTLTFVNLSTDQSINENASMEIDVFMQQKLYSTIADVCSSGDYLSSCIATLGNQGKSSLTNIYYHNGSLENGLSDNSYRYAGASDSVKNYVCFGTDEETCPEDNLYRIIGVIDGKVKLIKATSIGDMAWDSNGANTWSTSSINTYLNGDYLTSLGTFGNNIAKTDWIVSSRLVSTISHVVPKTTYTNEIVSLSSSTSSVKIGLMYVSDYGFAADPSAWTTTLVYYDGSVNGSTIKSLNWMYLGSYEWTIRPVSDYSNSVCAVFSDGRVDADDIITDVSVTMKIRPVFYLYSYDTIPTYVSGTGTSDDPYRIGAAANPAFYKSSGGLSTGGAVGITVV